MCLRRLESFCTKSSRGAELSSATNGSVRFFDTSLANRHAVVHRSAVSFTPFHKIR